MLLVGLLLPALTILRAQELSIVKAPSFAQHRYKPFKVDFSVGAAIPQGGGAKGGVLFAIEPKYSIIDKFTVGLRLEAAITARGWVASDGSSASASVAASASYLATYDYYLPGLVFRPFVGGGTGVYNMASASVSADNQNNESVAASSSTKFGTMARTGFELKHFRFAIEYNFIGKTTQTITDGTGNTLGSISAKNSYTSVKIGFFFGGGKR
jgi:outer membrane protein X